MYIFAGESYRELSGFLGNGATGSFSPVCDPSVATPGFSATERTQLVSLLSPAQSAKASQWNRQTHPGRSDIRPEDIVTDLARYVDFSAVRGAIVQQFGAPIATSKETIDTVFVEAVHQFQAKVYFEMDQQDGLIGASTLDSLGIVRHKLGPRFGNVYGRGILRGELSNTISRLTNGEFNGANWYDFIVSPAFLGRRIGASGDGIHPLLVRKLREAENYLLSLKAYAGMTPVALGRALGLDQRTVTYSGGRISTNKQAMHSFGLALDINPYGNPWIGAGWLPEGKEVRKWYVDQISKETNEKTRQKYQAALSALNERYRFVDTLKSAAPKGSRDVPKGGTIFAYLHGLAEQYGSDTELIHQTLARRSQEFVAYLKNNQSELRYWSNSFTFDTRNPLSGFLNLHPDLVYALRQIALLAWGAVDFGPYASGDIMHFDLRTIGAGTEIAEAVGGYVPGPGRHPVTGKKL